MKIFALKKFGLLGRFFSKSIHFIKVCLKIIKFSTKFMNTSTLKYKPFISFTKSIAFSSRPLGSLGNYWSSEYNSNSCACEATRTDSIFLATKLDKLWTFFEESRIFFQKICIYVIRPDTSNYLVKSYVAAAP